MCHVCMVRHGYQILCLLFALLRLFDDVFGGPHLCSSGMKSHRFKFPVSYGDYGLNWFPQIGD